MTVKSVKISRCNLIKNKKGNIIKFISKDNKLLSKFGEIYFSEIKKGIKSKDGIIIKNIHVY